MNRCIRHSLWLLLLSLLMCVACSRQAARSEVSAPTAMVSGDKDAPGQSAAFGGQPATTRAEPRGRLDRAFFSTNLAGERLLSYSMTLAYRGKSLAQARKTLLEIIPRHGFLESESANAEGEGQVSAVLRVRTARLMEALSDLDQLGPLVSENIAAEDLTEDDAKRRIKERREQHRILRRQAKAAATDADGRNASAAENALSQSEDRMDEAELEAWRIQDRVAWTRVAVTVSFPEAPRQISVPPFQNLGTRLASIGLSILYGAALVASILLMVLLVLGGIAALLWFAVARFIVRAVEKRRARP